MTKINWKTVIATLVDAMGELYVLMIRWFFIGFGFAAGATLAVSAILRIMK